jgi:hypothetical protein
MTTFADVELLVTTWLRDKFNVTVQTETDDTLEQKIPLIKVERIGGVDNNPGIDVARIDVECFAGTRQEASALADRVRAGLRFDLPGYSNGAGTVLGAICFLGPTSLPAYENPKVRRFLATYEITVHALT